MRTQILALCLLVAGCGASASLIPDVNDSGLSDNSDSAPPAEAGTPDVGTPDSNPPVTDSGDDSATANDSGTTDDSGSSSDSSVSDGSTCHDSGADVTDPCSGVVCPEAEVCDNGKCVCDGKPPVNNDAGCESKCDEGKTLLCHYPLGNWSNKHNICVGDAAVPAHLGHGDTLGGC